MLIMSFSIWEKTTERFVASGSPGGLIMKEATAKANTQDIRENVMFYFSLTGASAALAAAYILVLSAPMLF